MPGGEHPVSPLESDRRGSAVLAWVGGFVDAAGFLVLMGLFTAHMSGNSTGLGVALATGHWDEAIRRGFVIPIFVLATMAGVAWIEVRTQSDPSEAVRNRAIADVLGAEVLMLAVFFALGTWMGAPISLTSRPGEFVAATSAAAIAMGLQNAALRRVQATSVHTTFVTGMLTEFAVGIVRWILSSRRGNAEDARRARGVAEVAGLVWSTYAVGAVMGAWLVAHHGVRMILVPAAILALVALRLVRRRVVPET
ncbi:MAG: YoaK family protein [Verrucomicrobiota bacterium]